VPIVGDASDIPWARCGVRGAEGLLPYLTGESRHRSCRREVAERYGRPLSPDLPATMLSTILVTATLT